MLSQTEVKQLFDSIRNLKYRALLMTAYAGGLRTSEVVRLRLTDIDSERMVIRIHQGKGQKDRYVMLAPTLLKVPEIILAAGTTNDLVVSRSGRQTADHGSSRR